jgi:hypothetical protein
MKLQALVQVRDRLDGRQDAGARGIDRLVLHSPGVAWRRSAQRGQELVRDEAHVIDAELGLVGLEAVVAVLG